MKLVHPTWEKQITWIGEKIPVLSIENPKALYGYMDEMVRQTDGEKGNFCLSTENKIMDMKKNFLFLESPWSLDFSQKKITTKLFQNLKEMAQGELFYEHTERAIGYLLTYLQNLTAESPIPLTYNLDIDITELFKAVHIHVDENELCIEERLIQFMKTWNSLFGDTCFALNQFRNLIDTKNREILYENLMEEEIHCLFLEGKIDGIIEKEELFIIDEDLCQIF